jgi:FMN-dependent dehydrogenase
MAASAAAPDVVKALILGADAVACGQLYVYGLAAAGAEGMVRLFEILEDEIRICLSRRWSKSCPPNTPPNTSPSPAPTTSPRR